MNGSSRSLALLLALTVLLAGLLAYEAQRATRSHRVTAERALRDYSAVAGWEFMGAAADALDRSLAASLGPLLGTPAASPYDSLPQAAAVAAQAAGLLRCPRPGHTHVGFAYDFRTRTLTTDAAASPAILRWLADSVAAHGRMGLPAPGKAELLWRDEAIAVYGVKVLRYSGVARSDVPMAAYGMVTCPEALRPLFAGVMAAHPLLPGTVAGEVPNAELVSLRVLAPSGRTLYQSGPPLPTAADTIAAAGPGGLRVQTALPPAVAGRLLVSSPRSRLPLLLALLLLAAGLAAVAVRQLRREQELIRLRADFTSSVSHELRTPLTQILLFAETLELGRAGGEDARRQALGIIVQEARRLAHLVENVLQFSRAERRLLRVRPETVVLAPMLREIVERFAPLAGAAAVRLRTELDESVVARVHPDSLHQIVLNLLDNAVKHGGTGPIVLRAGLDGDWVGITVEDRGPGIAPGDRERIWEPFVRVGGAGMVAGSGLGLAVVRELVLGHGGRCRAEAAAGGGTRIVLELPGGSRLPADAPLPAARAAREG
ncbi:MAG TPA: HAMP domain-containing sensor histidine kinase [Gemmatimonadales bacterium]|nr:HAMP domain-containing sensor histidine kinase [Gemmatimonadales bacterium]